MLGARNRIAFALGDYDHAQPLVIDPTMAYSTYLGGSVEDFPFAIAADSSGSAYLAGEAFSPDFPVTAGAYQTSCTETGKTTCTPAMAYVTKLSPDGSSLVYSTFINGHTARTLHGASPLIHRAAHTSLARRKASWTSQPPPAPFSRPAM